MSDIATALAPEISPAPGKKREARKPTSKRVAGTGRKRGPARPYRKVVAEVLHTRIERLTKRIERLRRQHEGTRTLLTKYAHEKYYREREAIAQQEAPEAEALPAEEPLPEGIEPPPQ